MLDTIRTIILCVRLDDVAKRATHLRPGSMWSAAPRALLRRPPVLLHRLHHRVAARTDIEGVRERVTPVLLLPTAAGDAAEWRNTQQCLAARGFSSLAIDLPKTSAADEMPLWRRGVAAVKAATAELGPAVLLVAPCYSGFVAQKYLESNSLAALVLVGSLGPMPARDLQRIQDEAASPLPDALAELLAKDVRLRLEPGAVPTLVVHAPSAPVSRTACAWFTRSCACLKQLRAQAAPRVSCVKLLHVRYREKF